MERRRAALATDTDHQADVRVFSADGRTLWFHDVVTGGSGRRGVLSGVLIDITPLREADSIRPADRPRPQGGGDEIVDRVDAAVIATNRDGRVTYWNRHAERTYGWLHEDAMDQPLEKLVIPRDERERVSAAIGEAARGEGWERELETVRKDGTAVAHWVKAAPLREQSGDVVGMVWMSVDASRSPQAERALALSEAVKDGILQTSLDCIITMDATGRVIDFNPAAERTFGYKGAEVVGRELHELIVPERLRAGHREGLARHLATGKSRLLDRRLELAAMRSDGSEIPVELTVTRVDAGSSPVFVGWLRDLTAQYRAQERISHLATRDQLTGLPNRRLLREHLDVAMARVQRDGGAVALLYVDLDRFDLVNESLGRSSGDEVLRRVAARLDALDQAEVVAREGGDEFLVVAKLGMHSTGGSRSVGGATAHALGSLIREVVGRPVAIDDRDVQLGAHVGVSLFPGDAGDADALINGAEAALRDGQQGRVGVRLFEELEEGGGDRLEFVSDLRGALGRDEFELHYQPIVDLPVIWDLRSGGLHGLRSAMVGVEALIRWRHPERGLIAPNDFIPVLEDSGMIEDVGAWVVDAACAQSRRWSVAGAGIEMAVNLSHRELAKDGIARRLAGAAARAGIEPSCLVVELTESAAMTEQGRLMAALDDIAGAGFPVAIDDFGTGHSSLSRLWRMPVATLKIDRSFTAAVPADPAAAAMVTTIIRLAQGLGVRTLAEGIETEDQLRFLVAEGCSRGQGFLFSRPVPAEEITALLAGSG